MSTEKDKKDNLIAVFLQEKIDELDSEYNYSADLRDQMRKELDNITKYCADISNIIFFLRTEMIKLMNNPLDNQVEFIEGDEPDEPCDCCHDRALDDYTGAWGCKDYPDVDTHEYYANTCSGKCSGCKNQEDDDSEIMTVSDLANTIEIENKSPEQVMNELVIFTDEQVEEAITLAIWEYTSHNLADEVVSKFTLRGFIKYLEDQLSNDNEVEVDVSIDLANEILTENKGIYKISEGLYGRFQ